MRGGVVAVRGRVKDLRRVGVERGERDRLRFPFWPWHLSLVTPPHPLLTEADVGVWGG